MRFSSFYLWILQSKTARSSTSGGVGETDVQISVYFLVYLVRVLPRRCNVSRNVAEIRVNTGEWLSAEEG